MIKILKNHRISFTENQYIIFNTDDMQATCRNLEPARAMKLSKILNAEAISPLQAANMILSYKIVNKINIPLPF